VSKQLSRNKRAKIHFPTYNGTFVPSWEFATNIRVRFFYPGRKFHSQIWNCLAYKCAFCELNIAQSFSPNSGRDGRQVCRPGLMKHCGCVRTVNILATLPSEKIRFDETVLPKLYLSRYIFSAEINFLKSILWSIFSRNFLKLTSERAYVLFHFQNILWICQNDSDYKEEQVNPLPVKAG
jgi:hypothetical protein